MNNELQFTSDNANNTYIVIRNSIIGAQNKIYSSVNCAMVQAYWEIGQEIYKACDENDRADYGKKFAKIFIRATNLRIWKRLYRFQSTEYETVLSYFSKTLRTA